MGRNKRQRTTPCSCWGLCYRTQEPADELPVVEQAASDCLATAPIATPCTNSGPTEFSREEVARNAEAGLCWIIIGNDVYDVKEFSSTVKIR